MRMSWKLGRVAGIDLFVHPTFLLILLPTLFGGGLSLFFLVTLFGCVVLHELGHALMARRFGIETVNITLYPIGGVARLTRMPRAPGAELLIALAGPAVNFAIVAALLGLEFAGVTGLGTTSGLGELLSGLMVVNLVLGLFNLIPAFPMDGGRVLRAALSGWLGRARATSVAATIGRTLAVVFGIYSLLSAFPPNLLHVALAVFIYFAASTEEAGVLAEERRRMYDAPADNGIWTAPPGYRWVQRGQGVWQLAPVIVVTPGDLGRSSSTWTG
jgi:Zn-dependent protease